VRVTVTRYFGGAMVVVGAGVVVGVVVGGSVVGSTVVLVDASVDGDGVVVVDVAVRSSLPLQLDDTASNTTTDTTQPRCPTLVLPGRDGARAYAAGPTPVRDAPWCRRRGCCPVRARLSDPVRVPGSNFAGRPESSVPDGEP